MTKKPSYRFAGYTEPWEQRKLGECTEISAGGDIEKSKLLNNGKYPVIANALTSDGIVGYYNDSYRIEAPAVTVTGRGDVGVAKARNVNFTPVVRLLSLKSEHDVIFLENAINTQKIVIESTGVPQLTAPQLGRYKIFFPSLPEQTAIGSFFQDIDQLISLQQRKLEVLKEQKKTYLKLLFPAKGQTKPALRFAGFEDEWEQQKASEIFYSVSDKNHVDLPVLSASQEHGMVKRDEIGIDIKYDKASVKTYKRVKPGQFVIHLRSFQGGFAYSDIEGITSPAYTVIDFSKSNKHFDLFWKEVFTSQNFIKRLETVTYGIRDGRSISFSDFSSLKLQCPSLPEQEAIGSFFQDLDKAIAKQEEKVNQLKESKQTLLRKMFI